MAQPHSRRSLIKSPIFPVRGRSDYLYGDPKLDPTATEVMTNVNITERGTARKRNGYTNYNATQITESSVAKDVVGLHQQKFSDGSVKNLEMAGTKVYTDDGTTRTDITGSLTLTDDLESRCRFEFIKDQVVVTNGTDETFVYNGSGNATALGGVLWTKCGDVAVHKNLLFVMDTTESGTRYPTRLRWCDINLTTYQLDITVWPTDQYYEVYDGGAPILGGVEAFNRLMIVKSDGIYPVVVGNDDGFIEAMAEAPLRGSFSPVAPNSIIARPEFIWVIAEDGAYVVRPDMSFELITKNIQEEWNNLNPTRLQYAHSWVREKDHQVRTLVSSASNTAGHDVILVWDWQTGDIFIDKPAKSMNFASSWKLSNLEYDMFGTTDGYVIKGNDVTATTDGGTDISWRIKMKPNDLGSPGRNKQIVLVNTFIKTVGGSQTVEFICNRDQGRELSRTGNITIGTSLNWDSGVLWDSGEKWDGNQSDVIDFFVNRTAETIAPEWAGTEDFELQGYQVEYYIVD